MEKNRADNNSKESGIALVTALVITVVILMLIGSITYLYFKGLGTNIINRQFSTVYEAANGGVEYASGIVSALSDGTMTVSDVGNVVVTGDGTVTLSDIANCSNTTETATITAKTADAKYTITTTIQCVGSKPLPGYGGALRFPPPPSAAGGGIGSTATLYVFFSIRADATESSNSSNKGRTEAIYRVVR